MRFIISVFGLLALFITPANAQPTSDAMLKSDLAKIRQTTKAVGLGGLVMVDGFIIAQTADGERKKDSKVEVTADDVWHIGSITKSMTATIIGKQVDQGLLNWDMTLAEMLPDMPMDAAWKSVTLHHLLTHTAGLPGNFPNSVQTIWPDKAEELHAARLKALTDILASKPLSAAGEKHAYSNIGYTLAGYIAAEKAGIGWEALMQRDLFDPLELKNAGFGPPKGDSHLDQPWGHRKLGFLKISMDPKKRGADNTPVMGPAGTAHMTMQDLARYGWEHLRGETADDALLTKQTFQKLHTPVIDDYAYGLVSFQRDWAGDGETPGRIVWHNGSNTMWYALLVLVPEKNMVMVFTSNDGDVDKIQPQFFMLAKNIASDQPVTAP